MTPILYPLIGVGAVLAVPALFMIAYLLRYVLIAIGGAGLLTTIGAGIVTAAQGSNPAWLPWLALGSIGALAAGIVGEGIGS
jgi:hypothetical protein